MRNAVTGLPQLVQICQAANQRYLEALADAEVTQTVHEVLDPVSKRIERDGRPYRGLRPVTAEEAALFACLLDGKYRLQGFRNVDVRQILGPKEANDPKERRAACGRARRHLRLLRAHALIRKVPRTHCYRLTRRGTQVMTTALKFRGTSVGLLAA
jgi:hypothetical protein